MCSGKLILRNFMSCFSCKCSCIHSSQCSVFECNGRIYSNIHYALSFQIVPILRAGLALAEHASSILPATKTYHLGTKNYDPYNLLVYNKINSIALYSLAESVYHVILSINIHLCNKWFYLMISIFNCSWYFVLFFS